MKTCIDLMSYLQQIVDLKTRAKFKRPDGVIYGSLEEYVLVNGHAYMPQELDESETRLVKHALGKTYWQPKLCWYNAKKLSRRDVELIYVEGYAISHGLIPVQHAWCELNGKVIDPTWRLDLPNQGEQILGSFPEGWAYYGVVFHDRDIVYADEAGSVIDDWTHEWPLLRGVRP